MRILREGPGEPTVIEIAVGESIIVFDDDGGHEAMMADVGEGEQDEDGDEIANISAVEVTIALIALADPIIRALIEEKITDA